MQGIRALPRVLARIAAASLLVAIAASTVRADVLHMKGGQKIEGKIVGETSSEIEIRTKFGTMKLAKSKIARIERMLLPKEEFEKRLREAGEDPVLLWQAAVFARENKLDEEYRRTLELVVKADPNHTEANKALGKVYYDGRWFTPEELDAHKQAEAERMRAEGKVFYKGRWVPEEYAKRSQGYELYKGEWLTHKEIYLLEAQEKLPSLVGISLDARTSEHYILWSDLEDDLEQDILDMLEAAFDHFVRTFQPNEVELNLMTFYPVAVYVFPDASYVSKFAEDGGYMVQVHNPPKGINERYLDASSFPVFFPRPLIVTSMGRHLKGGGSRATSLMGFLAHYNGNVLIRRFKRGGKIPGWVESGVTHYYEATLNGYQTLSITEYTGFEHVEKWKQGLDTFLLWYRKMADPTFRSGLPRFRDFKGKMVEELDGFELCKSYFMVRWLLETRTETFVEYVRMAYSDPHMIRVTIPEEEAFEKTFGVDPDVLEREFEAWISTQPPTPPVERG